MQRIRDRRSLLLEIGARNYRLFAEEELPAAEFFGIVIQAVTPSVIQQPADPNSIPQRDGTLDRHLSPRSHPG